jgi:hypothetical protein
LPALGTEWGVAPVEQRERHALSLDDALRQIGTIKATEADAEDAVVDAAGAQRKYVSGRLRLLDGDVNGALREWEGALVDDPGSPRLAGEVGTLQVRAGRRSTGVTTLRTAVESGLRAAEPLRVLAREAARTLPPLGLQERQRPRFARRAGQQPARCPRASASASRSPRPLRAACRRNACTRARFATQRAARCR